MTESTRRHRPPIACLLAPAAAALLALPPGLSAAAGEPHAHVHGRATLEVAIDGARLEVALETPLENVLGFEHAPRTDAQRAQVRAMAAKLRAVPGLLVPTPAARCTTTGVTIESGALPPSLLAAPGGSAAGTPADAGDGHADLDASFAWTCAEPAKLDRLDVGLLAAFPGLKRVDVQVIGPRGQSASTLSGGRREVRW